MPAYSARASGRNGTAWPSYASRPVAAADAACSGSSRTQLRTASSGIVATVPAASTTRPCTRQQRQRHDQLHGRAAAGLGAHRHLAAELVGHVAHHVQADAPAGHLGDRRRGADPAAQEQVEQGLLVRLGAARHQQPARLARSAGPPRGRSRGRRRGTGRPRTGRGARPRRPPCPRPVCRPPARARGVSMPCATALRTTCRNAPLTRVSTCGSSRSSPPRPSNRTRLPSASAASRTARCSAVKMRRRRHQPQPFGPAAHLVELALDLLDGVGEAAAQRRCSSAASRGGRGPGRVATAAGRARAQLLGQRLGRAVQPVQGLTAAAQRREPGVRLADRVQQLVDVAGRAPGPARGDLGRRRSRSAVRRPAGGGSGRRRAAPARRPAASISSLSRSSSRISSAGSGAVPSRCGTSTSSNACARSAISGCLTTRAAPLSVCASRSSRATRSGPGCWSRSSTPALSWSTSSRASIRKYRSGSAGHQWRPGADQVQQVARERGQVRGGLLGLHRAGLGLPGGLGDVRGGHVDLLDRGGLLLGGQLDLPGRLVGGGHQLGDLPERAGRVVELARAGVDRLGAGLGGHHRGVDRAADVVDQRPDLLGRAGRPVGELADLVGHHREPAAPLAGAARLDGRVDGQDVGLLGQLARPGRRRRRSAATSRRAPACAARSGRPGCGSRRSTARAGRWWRRRCAAAAAVSSAICATRWALSAICREVTSSSLIVVVISLIALACSRPPVACWAAAASSSRRRALDVPDRGADLAAQPPVEPERHQRMPAAIASDAQHDDHDDRLVAVRARTSRRAVLDVGRGPGRSARRSPSPASPGPARRSAALSWPTSARSVIAPRRSITGVERRGVLRPRRSTPRSSRLSLGRIGQRGLQPCPPGRGTWSGPRWSGPGTPGCR